MTRYFPGLRQTEYPMDDFEVKKLDGMKKVACSLLQSYHVAMRVQINEHEVSMSGNARLQNSNGDRILHQTALRKLC